MLAREAQLAVVDFETTGSVPGHPDEPWQVGVVILDRGRTHTDHVFTSLLRVGDRPFSPHAPGRYRELTAEIAASPNLSEMWPHIRGWLCGRPLVGHNVATERKIIQAAYPLHQFGPWLDTLRLARIAWPFLPNHKLQTVAEHAEVVEKTAQLCPGREWHDALFDAMASALILEVILALPGWERMTVAGLEKARSGAR